MVQFLGELFTSTLAVMFGLNMSKFVHGDSPMCISVGLVPVNCGLWSCPV